MQLQASASRNTALPQRYLLLNLLGEKEAVYISGCIVYMWCVTLFQPTEFLTLILHLIKVIYKDKYNKK